MILALLLAEGRRYKRKLFELGCWFYEPMVPKRLMDDRLDRQSSIAERTAQRERAELEERIKHLQREVTRLSGIEGASLAAMTAPEIAHRRRTWWPCGIPF